MPVREVRVAKARPASPRPAPPEAPDSFRHPIPTAVKTVEPAVGVLTAEPAARQVGAAAAGGAGSSFYNTLLAVPGSGTWTPVSPPPYGQVTIQWEDAAGNLVAPIVSPQTCGMAGERTSQVAGLSTVSLQVIGGNGGQGSNEGKDPFNNGNALGGSGTGITASFTNTSATPQDITAIQGCPGAIATGGLFPTVGGFGLSNGANNYTLLGCTRVPCLVDSGSGGGGAAICVGNVDPGNDTASNNNCTSALPADILMLAGGGGGGGGASSFVSHIPGGAGGSAGIGANWPGGASIYPTDTRCRRRQRRRWRRF